MEELLDRLKSMPGSYNGFVNGIMAYARKKPQRIDVVLEYMKTNDELTCSDVVKFVSDQPDFYDDSVAKIIPQVG